MPPQMIEMISFPITQRESDSHGARNDQCMQVAD